MNLRIKILFILGSAISLFLSVSYFATTTKLSEGFRKIEHINTQENVHRVTDALNNLVLQLFVKESDWSSWDDTYHFIQHKNDDYVESNLNNTSFGILHVNFMLFVNKTGELVYGKYVDINANEELPLPHDISALILPSKGLIYHEKASSRIGGIVILGGAPFIVSSQPIVNSERTSPIMGTLIWGYQLDAAMLESIRQLTHTAFSFSIITPQLMELYPSLWGEKAEKILVQSESPQNIYGYTLIPDVYNKPAFILQITKDRPIYKQGELATRFFGFVLIASTLVFGLLLFVLLDKLVINRLSLVGTTLDNITRNQDLSYRIPGMGKDEIGKLVIIINGMLYALQKAHDQLELRVEERTSELHNSLKELEKVNRELSKLSQMKSEFTAMVSHEIRTPFSAIKEGINMLLEGVDGPLSQNQKETLNIVQTSIERLSRLINNVLDLSKLEAGKTDCFFERINFNDMIGDVSGLMTPSFRKKEINFSFQAPATPVWGVCDSDKLKQVLVNLLDNAVKFTPQKGHITVRLTSDDDHITIDVEDNGLGIKEEDQKNLFQMFEQVKNKGRWKTGGSGLGLALCQKIIDQHKGQLLLKSIYEKGTIFSVIIPTHLEEKN